MNTNLIHNILNLAITIIAPLAAFDWSTIVSQGTALKVIAVLGATKLVINVLRDGIAGLSKPQPPVQ